MINNNFNRSGGNPFNPRGNENINNIYNMNSNRSYGQHGQQQQQQEWRKNSSALSTGTVKYNQSKRRPKKAMKMPCNPYLYLLNCIFSTFALLLEINDAFFLFFVFCFSWFHL